MKASLRRSGIYQILNTRNGHSYVGQAYNLEGRKKEHFSALRRNKHDNPHLQNTFNKYGEGIWLFIILKLLQGYGSRKALNLMLTAWEQCFFDTLHPEYNDNLLAGRPPGSCQKGQTYEEYYGPERAAEIQKKQSKSSMGLHSGERSGRFGDHRTFEERFGIERAAEISKKQSQSHIELMTSERHGRFGDHRTYEERFGVERAAEIQKKQSNSHMGLASGERHPNYGDHRTNEERYGRERAAEIKRKSSRSLVGLNSGKRHGNYGDHRTYDERFGLEKAAELCRKKSEAMKEHWVRIRAARNQNVEEDTQS